MSQTIAIVEDDADQRRNYADAIASKGYKVLAFANRPAAMEVLNQQKPDLAVLDIILENEIDGGFQLCRELLTLYPDLPVIFLTERVDEIDRISGLRMGAWDYQPKPISLNFLAERVSSLLRLTEVRASPPQEETVKGIGNLLLLDDSMVAKWKGQPVDLTVTEFRILAAVTRRPEHAVTYDALMSATKQQYVTHNTLNTHMRNIRKKFKNVDNTFDCIKNEYGFGYRWHSG